MSNIINIEQILLYYDTVQLFIGVDCVKTYYLCILYEEMAEDRYLAIKISPSKLSLLLTGSEDLRVLYLNPEIDKDYYSLAYSSEGFIIKDRFEVPEERMLPEEGAFEVNACRNAFEKDLIDERLYYSRPIIHLGFVDRNNNKKIKAETLSILLNDFQELLNNIYKKIDSGTHSAIRVPELHVFSTSLASFNLHMYVEDDLNLFGGSSIDNALLFLNSILDYQNDDLLIDSLSKIKGYAVSYYKKFLENLLENEINIKTAWTTSDVSNPVFSNYIEVVKLRKAYEILDKVSDLEEENQILNGFFVKIDMINGGWKFYDTNEECIYKGSSNNKNILSGLVVRTKNYKILCVRKSQKNIVTDKVKTDMVLIKIDSVE